MLSYSIFSLVIYFLFSILLWLSFFHTLSCLPKLCKSNIQCCLTSSDVTDVRFANKSACLMTLKKKWAHLICNQNWTTKPASLCVQYVVMHWSQINISVAQRKHPDLRNKSTSAAGSRTSGPTALSSKNRIGRPILIERYICNCNFRVCIIVHLVEFLYVLDWKGELMKLNKLITHTHLLELEIIERDKLCYFRSGLQITTVLQLWLVNLFFFRFPLFCSYCFTLSIMSAGPLRSEKEWTIHSSGYISVKPLHLMVSEWNTHTYTAIFDWNISPRE